MAQFDRQIDTALRLIKKNGQAVEWIQKTRSTLDPLKPWEKISGTQIAYNPFICFLPLDLQGKEFIFALSGSEAASGTFYGLMANVPFVPSMGDTVKRNGVELDIASIDLLSPNGQKILYTIIFNG